MSTENFDSERYQSEQSQQLEKKQQDEEIEQIEIPYLQNKQNYKSSKMSSNSQANNDSPLRQFIIEKEGLGNSYEMKPNIRKSTPKFMQNIRSIKTNLSKDTGSPIHSEETMFMQKLSFQSNDQVLENLIQQQTQSLCTSHSKDSLFLSKECQKQEKYDQVSDTQEELLSKSSRKGNDQRKVNQRYQNQIQRIQQLKSSLKQQNNGQKMNISLNSNQSLLLKAKQNLIDRNSIQILRNSLLGSTNQMQSKVAPINSIFKQHKPEEKSNQPNWGIMNKLGIAMKIKQKLLSLITQRISSITLYQHYLIGDYSDALNSKLFKKTPNMINKFSSVFLTIVNPGSALFIFTKIFLSIITLFNLIFLPMLFGFDIEIQIEIVIVLTVSSFFYLLEIFFNFRTAYYEMGELVTESKKISKRYLKGDFCLDVFTIIFLMLGLQYRFLIIISLLKVKNLRQYLWDIDTHYFLSERYHAVWVMLKLFGFIIFICHYFACIFHYAGYTQINDPNLVTWIEAQGLLDAPWSLRYNYSIYFSFITCITIGYGDITPKNIIERNVTIIISLISTGCFSYSINTMGTIFQQYLKQIKKSKEMRFDAINYMQDRQINKKLQLRVLKYIDYINEMKLKSPDKGLMVINSISNQLRSKLFKDFYGKILKQNKNFNLNYSAESLEKLSLKMKERIYGPGEIIFEQKEQDFKIYYLMKGEIEFYIHNKDGNKQSEYISISSTTKSNFFGYKGFISGIPREMTCRSVNVSHVFYCSREDLISVLKEDPLDYEQFCKVRDEYSLYTNSLGEQCFSCQQFGHTISLCHKIHLVKNKQLMISKHNFSQLQKRSSFKRTQHKYQTLLNIQLTSFEGMKFKLKQIMNLRKQYLQDEIIEQIIIQDFTTDKMFQLQFPSILFRDKEYILNEADDFDEEDSDLDSDVLSDMENELESNLNSEEDEDLRQITSQPQMERQVSEKKKLTFNIKTKKASSEKNNRKNNQSLAKQPLASFFTSSSSEPSSNSDESSSSIISSIKQNSSQKLNSINEANKETKIQQKDVNIDQQEEAHNSKERHHKQKAQQSHKKMNKILPLMNENRKDGGSLVEFENKFSEQKRSFLEPQNEIALQRHQQMNEITKSRKSFKDKSKDEGSSNFNINFLEDNDQPDRLLVKSKNKIQDLHISQKKISNMRKQSVENTFKKNGKQLVFASTQNRDNILQSKSSRKLKLNNLEVPNSRSSELQPSLNELQQRLNQAGNIKQSQNQSHKTIQNAFQANKNNNQKPFGDENSEYDLGIIDFDSIKEFQRYYPHNNISVVCFNFRSHINKKNMLKKYILNHTQELMHNLKCKSLSGLHSILIQTRKNRNLLNTQNN